MFEAEIKVDWMTLSGKPLHHSLDAARTWALNEIDKLTSLVERFSVVHSVDDMTIHINEIGK